MGESRIVARMRIYSLCLSHGARHSYCFVMLVTGSRLGCEPTSSKTQKWYMTTPLDGSTCNMDEILTSFASDTLHNICPWVDDEGARLKYYYHARKIIVHYAVYQILTGEIPGSENVE